MKRVQITIKGGKVNADFSGFVGKACDALAERIHPEELEQEEKTLKDEYNYGTEAQTSSETERWS